MKLNTVERERLTDSVLKIQSVRASLDQMDEEKVPKLEQMENCLEGVDHGLREALGYGRGEAQGKMNGKKNDKQNQD